MAAIMRDARAVTAVVTVAATIIGATAIIGRAAVDRPAVIIAVGVIVIATAVGGCDSDSGADDAGKCGSRGSAAAPAIVPAAGAEISGIARARA